MAPRIKFLTDIDKACITANFADRGYVEGTTSNWNIYWASTSFNSTDISCLSLNAIMSDVPTCRQLFTSGAPRLAENQIICHFPNNWELTRKDFLIKIIKRYKRELEKANYPELVDRFGDGKWGLIDFLPTSYILPADFNLFAEEYRRNPKTTWIMKPSNSARGMGIFLINRLSQIKPWSTQLQRFSSAVYATSSQSTREKDTYVISRYIDRPLLINSKKFDIRLYVLVTSWKPLIAFTYDKGFCRFCSKDYVIPNGEFLLDDKFVHLTNVSVQQKSEDYNELHGNKFALSHLFLFLASAFGKGSCEWVKTQIECVVMHSLRSVKDMISNDRHCFECYGYDLIIDSALKVWLIEINASPSMTSTTVEDRITKHELVNDILDIVVPPGFPDLPKDGRGGVATGEGRERVGGWKFLKGVELVDKIDQRGVEGVLGTSSSRPGSAARPPGVARKAFY